MLIDKKSTTEPNIVITEQEVNNHNFTGGAIQAKNRYVTAMQVIKPRNLNRVISKCVEEASIAGEEFIYSWKQGGSIIEGLTIGAALSIVRNFGNCFVDVEVEEQEKAYIFTAYFCDLETGFNLSRSFRQNKQSPKTKYGKDIYEGDRGIDIIFQIGQSKAIRNVVLNAVPRWLATKVLEEAKNNAMATINNMGEVKARELLLKKISNLQVSLEKVENLFGKAKSWDKIKLVQLSSALKTLENGYEDEDTLFPDVSVTTRKEILTQAEKEALLEINETPSSNTNHKRTQVLRVSQEILNLSNGDYKKGTELLAKIFGRKFKLNTSFTAQLTQEEIDRIDGKLETLLKEIEDVEEKVA
ncbi:hypothetical protein JHD49_01490 [Sulfurimonas sp. SAG-AH-194-C21]|nr:hypothetical protein [Sulfurimonas sp. SAG-AH-194-C21]MDF1882608.1 hypothetical protein [Sulfurimonas sp. SAG-AH-194-C21]